MHKEFFPEHEQRQPGSKWFDGDKFVPAYLAEAIMKEAKFRTRFQDREIFIWNSKSGLWEEGQKHIEARAKEELGPDHRSSRVREVVDYIRNSSYDKCEPPPADLVPLANGVLHLNPSELKEPSPEYFFTNKLLVEFKPEARCPNFEKFLSEILPDTADRETVLEMFAYTLHGDYTIHKAFMFIGSGRNGKTTLLRVLEALLGKKCTVSVDLQSLVENRFAAAELYGKMANIQPDLPNRKLFATGKFKALVGEDYLTVERKHRDPFDFLNRAKLIFACNELPPAAEESDAYHARWMILTFPNRFTGNKADRTLLTKLTAPEELSGILNLLLPAYRSLLERGYFKHEKPIEEMRELYLRKSDPIAAFFLDWIEFDPEAEIGKEELYAAFGRYCAQNKMPIKPDNVFAQEVKRRGAGNVYSSRPRSGDKRVSIWRGLKLGEEANSGTVVSEGLGGAAGAVGAQTPLFPPFMRAGIEDKLTLASTTPATLVNSTPSDVILAVYRSFFNSSLNGLVDLVQARAEFFVRDETGVTAVEHDAWVREQLKSGAWLEPESGKVRQKHAFG